MRFKYVLNIAAFGSLAIFLASCGADSDRSNDRSNAEDFSRLKLELQVFKEEILSKIEDLNGKVDEVDNDRFHDSLNSVKQSDFLNFETETTDDLMEIKRRIISSSAIFNLKENKGFSKINSDGLIFCVAFENVQPYLDGFKVSFKVGNPFFVTFLNPKVRIKWGRDPFKYLKEQKSGDNSISEVFDAWKKSLKEKESTVLKDLKPGVWNNIEMVLTPSKLDEIEHVEISIEVNMVSFYKDTNAS